MPTHQLVPPPTTALPLPPLDDPPDWNSIHETIRCPLCGYELRGLREPMCPECGYRFNWPDLLDPARRLHPWLFEHHRRRNIWSFTKTLFRNFRPGRFWIDLHPNQPSRLGRLVVYWVPCALLAMLPLAILVYDRWEHAALSVMPRSPGLVSGLLSREFVHELWRDDAVRATLLLCLLAAAFPWISALALLIFQQSMGRAKVKTQHVLRCAIYSGDVILWGGLLSSVAVVYWLFHGSWWQIEDRVAMMIFAVSAAALLLNFARLVSAYRNYLKFDRAFATVLAAQIVVLLAAFTIFLNVMEFL